MEQKARYIVPQAVEPKTKYITINGETIPELGDNLAEVKMIVDESLTIDEKRKLIKYLLQQLDEQPLPEIIGERTPIQYPISESEQCLNNYES